MTGPTRILYVTGSGRSGSNLLGHILGQVDGFSFVGEAMYAGASLVARRCGCGVPLSECEFWLAARRGPEGGRLLPAPEFFGLGRLARWRHLPLTLWPGAGRRLEGRYGAHWEGAARQYARVAALSGAEVIVDSSKAVPFGRALSLAPGLDVRVVHLVRDARAVAYSWRRLKLAPDRFHARHMARREPGLASLMWLASNLGAESLLRPVAARWLRLRYEDLVARPRESVERVLRLATDRPVAAPFVGERTVRFRATHSVAGNPDRMRTGPVVVQPDDEWKRLMNPADYRLVTGLTWPLLRRYGYLGREGRAT